MEKDILNFIFEVGQLKKVKREGWRLIGMDNLESVADHTLRASQIGFILAKLENYENPLEVCTMVVFHDIGECRIGDIHRVANRYINVDEEIAVKEQTEKLGEIGRDIFNMWKQVEDRNTKAGIIAKEADMLELAITAKENIEKGYSYAQDWINNISKALLTESGKKLLNELKNADSNKWWQGLKKLKYS
ncbi:HD domain-containing protein [Candidatus Woesearchaeota archaeon]|nr:HD domain-containing protein [Candidatus Woesearchaeota archaeon]